MSADGLDGVARSLEPPPAYLGITHWSSRLLGIGDATIARCWRRFGLQPWRRESFKSSTDLALEAKARDVVGLYRHEELLALPKKVARSYPRRDLHVGADNYGTHKHTDVERWLSRHPRVTLHFTPTSGSRLNLVEVFFGIITRQAIRRGSFTPVKDLVDATAASSAAGAIAATRSSGDEGPRRGPQRRTVASEDFRRGALATNSNPVATVQVDRLSAHREYACGR